MTAQNTETDTEVKEPEKDSFVEARERADSFFTDEDPEENTDTGEAPELEPNDAEQGQLAALKAERQKRQLLEEQIKMYQQQNSNQTQPPEEDLEEIVDRRLLKEEQQSLRIQLREDAWQDSNPDKLEFINERLADLYTKESWTKQAVESADNRYAMAYKLCSKFLGDSKAAPAAPKNNPQEQARQMVENSKKPRSAFSNKTPPQQSKSDYLRSIGGTKEFKEFRKRVRGQ